MVEPTTPYDGPERRQATRAPADLPISVRQKGRGQRPAMLTALSPDGCTVTQVTLSEADGPVWVRMPGLESQPARCVWQTHGIAGLAFEHALHPAVASRFYRLPAPTEVVVTTSTAPAPADDDKPVSRREQILFGNAEPPSRLLRHKPQRESNAALMRMVRRQMARVVDQRLEVRFPAPGRAALGFRVAGQPAKLSDLSPSGLKVADEIPGSIGNEVRIALAGFPAMDGRIVWFRDGSTGIRLPDNALDLFDAA